MKSYEAIQKAIAGKTVDFARKLGVSTSLVNKWQEPSTDFTDSGALNPLDRIETIIEESQRQKNADAFAPLHYLAERFGLVIIGEVKGPVCLNDLTAELLSTSKEFGELAASASKALKDNRLTSAEIKTIKKEGWELIRQTASFLRLIEEVSK